NYLLPIDTAVSSLVPVKLNTEQSKAVGFGQRVKIANETQIYGQVRLFSDNGIFLGVAEIREDNVIRPSRMINV
ncbi:tRNA pseudouridine(55) synthase TruB, partial [Glaesserella sp.]|uniref:tRNA pseudouridine(55) synthase TruB n=1 Tax=Glaesserella sp. TaxID=2094731 RepID=UPI00359F9595